MLRLGLVARKWWCECSCYHVVQLYVERDLLYSSPNYASPPGDWYMIKKKSHSEINKMNVNNDFLRDFYFTHVPFSAQTDYSSAIEMQKMSP